MTRQEYADKLKHNLEHNYIPIARHYKGLIETAKTRTKKEFYAKKLKKLNMQAQHVLFELSTLLDENDKVAEALASVDGDVNESK